MTPDLTALDCSNCNGEGQHRRGLDCPPFCQRCIDEYECPVCDGTGKVDDD